MAPAIFKLGIDFSQKLSYNKLERREDVTMKRWIHASDLLRFEFLVKRYDNDSHEVEVICAESEREAEDQLNNDEYVEYLYVGILFYLWIRTSERRRFSDVRSGAFYLAGGRDRPDCFTFDLL